MDPGWQDHRCCCDAGRPFHQRGPAERTNSPNRMNETEPFSKKERGQQHCPDRFLIQVVQRP